MTYGLTFGIDLRLGLHRPWLERLGLLEHRKQLLADQAPELLGIRQLVAGDLLARGLDDLERGLHSNISADEGFLNPVEQLGVDDLGTLDGGVEAVDERAARGLDGRLKAAEKRAFGLGDLLGRRLALDVAAEGKVEVRTGRGVKGASREGRDGSLAGTAVGAGSRTPLSGSTHGGSEPAPGQGHPRLHLPERWRTLPCDSRPCGAPRPQATGGAASAVPGSSVANGSAARSRQVSYVSRIIP